LRRLAHIPDPAVLAERNDSANDGTQSLNDPNENEDSDGGIPTLNIRIEEGVRIREKINVRESRGSL
jgi:hypothetical protein